MREFIYNPDTLKKIEFWAATTIFVFAVFFLSTSAVNPEIVNRISDRFDEANFTFHYYENYFFPKLIQYTVLYGAFCFLNFKVVPNLITRESLARDIVFVTLVFILIGLVFGITNTYLKNYLFAEYETEDATYNAIFQQSFLYAFWLLFMFGFYTVVKYTSLHLLANSEDILFKYQLITRDGLIAFVLWMVSMFLLLLGDVDGEFLISWGIIIPSGILFYLYSFYTLIPKALGKKKPFRAYLGKTFLIQILAILPLSLLIFIIINDIINDEEIAIVLSLFNAAFQLLFTAPLAWSLFKRQMKGKEEIFVLQKELGRSNANLDFLRAQINPHFLFNTLNTLYGTALQENSERTAQGIQMLGDMMRFMLHENHQPKILLSREIEYMQNYIVLQSLRTSTSPDIVIQTKIEEVVAEKFIAPMLLIPFVENAFKHGISLKNKSWIRITLHYDQNKLYFDVYNSTHVRQENDLEKDKSGVGLDNVKQRLALLYPTRHDLVIRETSEEFFVHLTLQL